MLKKLLKVYDWAVDSQPYKVGDRVTLTACTFDVGHGFWPYNNIFKTGPEGVVEAVEFNGAYDTWGFRICFDAIPGKTFTFSADSFEEEETDKDLVWFTNLLDHDTVEGACRIILQQKGWDVR